MSFGSGMPKVCSVIAFILVGFDSIHAESWPEALEKPFQERCRYVIESCARSGKYGNTFFENEKRSYGWAMLSTLGGHEKEALRFLESEDANAKGWNQVTMGIDFFPAFTLKHQVRKYFYFGDQLSPGYRKRMKQAAGIFTEKDPYRRPHPFYKKGTSGWTPEMHNSWVDIRNTDNLKLMRDTSVYLFAEETGNEEVRKIYANHIRRFVEGLHTVGMSEWDSENFLGHSVAPLLNLHDFAKDPSIRQWAKVALDWITLTGDLKYRHGIWGGPNKRDYNHPIVFGGSASALFWLWFGDTPSKPTHFESDEIHLITSNYRPPLAAVEIARKNGLTDHTIHSCKPGLESWNHYETSKPQFRETLYFGSSFQLGTLWRGTQAPDINGFKLLVDHAGRGADAIVAAPCSDPARIGSPMYLEGILAPKSAIGQNRNLAVYLTKAAGQPYLFWVPADAGMEKISDQLLILRFDESTIAIWPINLSLPQFDKRATLAARTSKKGKPRWPDVQVLRGNRIKDQAYGFAIEAKHTPTESAVRRFMESASKTSPDTSELAVRSAITHAGTNGQRIRLQWGDTAAAIKVWADGQASPFNDPETAFVFRGEPVESALPPLPTRPD